MTYLVLVKILIYIYLTDIQALQEVSELEIKLRNGRKDYEGLLFVRDKHKPFSPFGTICDDGWGQNEVNTVCRQLGYKRGVLRQAPFFGMASKWVHIYIDDVKCTEHTLRLENCTFYRKWGSHNCKHYEDVGVSCYHEKIQLQYEDHMFGAAAVNRSFIDKSTVSDILIPSPFHFFPFHAKITRWNFWIGQLGSKKSFNLKLQIWRYVSKTSYKLVHQTSVNIDKIGRHSVDVSDTVYAGRYDVIGFQYESFNAIPYDDNLRCIISDSNKMLHLKEGGERDIRVNSINEFVKKKEFQNNCRVYSIYIEFNSSLISSSMLNDTTRHTFHRLNSTYFIVENGSLPKYSAESYCSKLGINTYLVNITSLEEYMMLGSELFNNMFIRGEEFWIGGRAYDHLPFRDWQLEVWDECQPVPNQECIMLKKNKLDIFGDFALRVRSSPCYYGHNFICEQRNISESVMNSHSYREGTKRSKKKVILITLLVLVILFPIIVVMVYKLIKYVNARKLDQMAVRFVTLDDKSHI